MTAPRRVVFALFPGCEILDFAGPLQAFHEASLFGARYDVVQAAATPELRTAQGLTLSGLAPFPDVGPGDVHDLTPGKQGEDDAPRPGAHAAISVTGRAVSVDSSPTSAAVDTMRANRRRSA